MSWPSNQSIYLIPIHLLRQVIGSSIRFSGCLRAIVVPEIYYWLILQYLAPSLEFRRVWRTSGVTWPTCKIDLCVSEAVVKDYPEIVSLYDVARSKFPLRAESQRQFLR